MLSGVLGVVLAETFSILVTVFIVDSLYAYRSRKQNSRLTRRMLVRVKQELSLQHRLMLRAKQEHGVDRIEDIETAYAWKNQIATITNRAQISGPLLVSPVLESRAEVMEILSHWFYELNTEIAKLEIIGWFQSREVVNNKKGIERSNWWKFNPVKDWIPSLDTRPATDYSFKEYGVEFTSITLTQQLDRVLALYDEVLGAIDSALEDDTTFWKVLSEDNILREMIRRPAKAKGLAQ
jgi:hypothetical protein